MLIFVDTTQFDLFILIANKDKVIDFIWEKKIANKVEILANKIKFLLEKNKLKLNQIDKYFLNLGPGTFTGCRIAFTYISAIVLVFKKKIYTTNSFILGALSLQKNEIAIPINLQKSYLGKVDLAKKKFTFLGEFQKTYDEINYQDIAKNFVNKYQNFFKLENDINQIFPIYLNNFEGN